MHAAAILSLSATFVRCVSMNTLIIKRFQHMVPPSLYFSVTKRHYEIPMESASTSK